MPLLFVPLADVLLFNIGRCIMTSYGMFIVFGPAHFPAEAAALDRSQKDVDYVLPMRRDERWTAAGVRLEHGRVPTSPGSAAAVVPAEAAAIP